MKRSPHFKATLTYFATEDGGIVTPVSSGFRCIFRFPYLNQDCLASQTFIETELVFAGDTVSADIILLEAKEILEKIYKGLDFDLFVNLIKIGSGIITDIYVDENKNI